MSRPAILSIIGALALATALRMPAMALAQDRSPDMAALTIKANAGDAAAMTALGETLVESDEFTALDWWRKAAGLGDAEAMRRMGALLFSSEVRDDLGNFLYFDDPQDCNHPWFGLEILYHEPIPNSPEWDAAHVPRDAERGQAWIQAAAERGDATAMCLLSTLASDRKDAAEAARWRRKAADAGDKDAMKLMALSHLTGEGAPKDRALALTWMTRVRKGDREQALLDLAGLPDGGNDKVAWLQQAVDEGSLDALRLMARSYAQGRDVAKDEVKAAALFLRAAARGDISSQIELGDIYKAGIGVAVDQDRSLFWQKEAAKSGWEDVNRTVGLRYLTGDGPPKDEQEAVRWYAAEAMLQHEAKPPGEAEAMLLIAGDYENGEDLPRDDVQALRWYLAAANAGSTWAMLELSSIYWHGEGVTAQEARLRFRTDDGIVRLAGVKRDVAASQSWRDKAVALGNPSALAQLAAQYEDHDRREAEAASLWRRVADLGDPYAMYRLSRMYADGRGVAKDAVEAEAWLTRGRKAGLRLMTPGASGSGPGLMVFVDENLNENRGVIWMVMRPGPR